MGPRPTALSPPLGQALGPQPPGCPSLALSFQVRVNSLGRRVIEAASTRLGNAGSPPTSAQGTEISSSWREETCM